MYSRDGQRYRERNFYTDWRLKEKLTEYTNQGK